MSDMTGKVALVTGASSGIGRATALLFAARGAKVSAAARRADRLDSLVREITEAGGEATAIATDVSSASDVEAMVAHAIDAFGRLDYCVNSAGIEGEGIAPIFAMSEALWSRVMDVNVKGNFLCLKYQAKAMIEAGNGGAIVNVGSVNSFVGFGGGAAYSTSKAAQITLSSSAAADLAPHGIRVNLVCPGFVDTEMHRRIRGIVTDEGMDGMIAGMVPLQRAAAPEEMARTIAWLCSDEASYVNATTITADGGLHGTL
ncbi:MAG: SDR family oxidoreductase [Gemmatimonadales bacterium]|jgi:NAD(P)-dependent dehydrogenase (short-subunit alcohol dehydrogenase family)|nr:MAG: SDR family oxidoreductase [Gemmatimonadales bacterium]